MAAMKIQPKKADSLDLLALGALVTRLDPGIIPFGFADSYQIHVSGGEYNVAANLSACFGQKTAIASAMVDYPIGAKIESEARKMGVKGIYKRFRHDGVSGPNMAQVWSDRGQGVRAPVVFYNRANEAAALLKPGDFDWDDVFARGLRWFHSGATTIMVATRSLQAELEGRGFGKPSIWSRGVDTELYRPRPDLLGEHYLGLPRPVYLYVGRVAVEKNIEAFLDLELAGSKMIVGDGPRLEHLRKRHPEAHFAGAMFGEDLAKAYAAADCFVFPSRTDTFGLVLIEALAAGTPVAAYPVQGPLDVIGSAPVAVLDEDLKAACVGAVNLSRVQARDFALGFSWDTCTRQFLSNLALEEEMPATPEKLAARLA